MLLKKEHLPEAGRPVSARCRLLRAALPLLPACYEQPGAWPSRLERIAPAGPGAAVLRAGKLAGFLTGWRIPWLRGQRAANSPEWVKAFGTAHDSRPVFEELSAALSAAWVAKAAREKW